MKGRKRRGGDEGAGKASGVPGFHRKMLGADADLGERHLVLALEILGKDQFAVGFAIEPAVVADFRFELPALQPA